MRPRGRRARTAAVAAARAAALRALAAAESQLQAALSDYAAQRTGRPDVRSLRAAHARLTTAYRDAFRAATAAERFAPGSLRTRIGELETALQRHLLGATYAAGVLVPSSVRVSSRAALAPRIAGLGFGYEDPYGPPGTRTIGVDLAGEPEEGQQERAGTAPAAPADLPAQRTPASATGLVAA